MAGRENPRTANILAGLIFALFVLSMIPFVLDALDAHYMPTDECPTIEACPLDE